MREILFRGKRIDNGEWVYGYYARKGADKESFRHYICVSTFSSDYRSNYTYPFYLHDYEVDPSTVGQYTDLTDKNGKKIFEGDICIVKENGESDYATVGFEHGAFVIYPVNGKITEKTLWDVWYNDFSIEVIGNIHDNFELFNNSELLEDKL